jgi:precorrin-8X/cobalt-precorrin-8 methylmutase
MRSGCRRCDAPWRATWQRIAALLVDDEHNANNRFEVAAVLNRTIGGGHGPFWGCPAGRRYDGLAPTKPSTFPLAEFRATERALRAAGRRPMSVWQLAGAGSVGGQSLTAIPVLERLLTEHGAVAVWPFTTGWTVPSLAAGGVVVAEVWPTAFDPPTPAGEPRDAAQVRHVAERLRDADRDGSLARWCAPPVGGLDGIDAAAVTGEEGWVLGPVERPLLR